MASSALTGPLLSDVSRSADGAEAAPSWSFQNSPTMGFYRVSANVLGLSTAGVQRMVVDASGNVGIGTGSPAVKLEVNGSIRMPASTGFQLGNGSTYFYTTATSNGDFVFGTSSSDRARIDASGNLLVGRSSTVSNPGANTPSIYAALGMLATNGSSSSNYQHDRINFNGGQFYVLNGSSTGVILTSGQTSWAAQSDERAKKNIKPLELGLEQINALKPSRFDYNQDESEESSRVGFIAQEVLPVLPHAVSVPEDPEQMMGVSATEMIPVLVKAIQELSAKVDAQAAEIEALKAK